MMNTSSETSDDRRHEFGTPEYNACPYDLYATARDTPGPYALPGANMVMISRFDDLMQACRAPESFSSHRADFGSGDPEIEKIMNQGWRAGPTLVTADPPEHTRYRKLVSRPFTASAVARHEPLIRETVGHLIDRFIGAGQVELLSQFALPLPTRITGSILGVPEEDQEHFGRWADMIAESVSGYLPRERGLECARGLVEMQHYFADLIKQRTAHPGEDLISDLVMAEEDDERPLDLPEILELVRIFVAGGTESTASLLGSAFYLLLAHPDQFAQVRADHSLIPQMLEEVLRLESPVQWNPRMVENGGVTLNSATFERGTRVMLAWGAGNRDKLKFGENADQFDIHRGRTQHAAFGHGYHFCLGAPLARLEARIACEQLLERIPSIELDVDPADVRFVGHGVVRRLDSLPLRFEAVP